MVADSYLNPVPPGGGGVITLIDRCFHSVPILSQALASKMSVSYEQIFRLEVLPHMPGVRLRDKQES